ncbi:MAG: Mut7-C ubiquitin/RNAse domain-containing protein [Acidobacteriaceae bacterium]|nr:Mut7-C ubiquitin/RNAse domain-containing protein [Acidobacteriaceae bacterium]
MEVVVSTSSPYSAHLRFFAELNDHLPPGQKFQTLEKRFYTPGTVKDIIESFGVPHTEVELIVANGESVDFSYLVQDGDRIGVYPVFEAFDIRPELRVRRYALRNSRFVLDVHLGKLAAYLRMLGFDTLYQNCFTDAELAQISLEQNRILLTRDRGLLKRGLVTHGYWLRETDSRRQAAEVIRRFDLADGLRPFSRCMACNGILEAATKEEVLEHLPPRTAELHNEFKSCHRCGRIYWKGSHHRRMLRFIKTFVAGTEMALVPEA